MINIYCDESCHLEHSQKGIDNQKSMVIGGIKCNQEHLKQAVEDIKRIKEAHGLNRYNEMKWTKVSKNKYSFYKEIIEYFFSNENLEFRCVIFPDKSKLDYSMHDHDDIYNIMYYLLLNNMISDPNLYNIYVDKKDTRGSTKFKNLRVYLCRKHKDFDMKKIEKIQIVDSKDLQLMQLTDLLIGAMAYYHRGLVDLEGSSKEKSAIVKLISDLSHVNLNRGTNKNARKFNIFIWESWR